MQWFKREFFSTVFLKFFLVSGFAALMNFLSRIVFNLVMSYPAAIFMAFWVGLTTGFTLNRQFVFPESVTGNTRKQFFYFLAVNLFALLQTMLVSLFLAWYLLPAVGVTVWSREIAHFAGISFPMFVSFLGHKYFSFKTRDVIQDGSNE
jgi:putative flippase GtrA